MISFNFYHSEARENTYVIVLYFVSYKIFINKVMGKKMLYDISIYLYSISIASWKGSLTKIMRHFSMTDPITFVGT